MARLVTLLAVVFSASIAAAQTPPPFPPGLGQPSRDTGIPTSTSIIKGHVVDASNGRPLRKVQVRATSPELRENRVAITDNNGAYELKNMPAGRYNLSAQKGSFVSLQYGQTRPFEPGKPLELRDAQVLDKVDFSLPRGAIITGRVVDETGEPSSDVQVSVQRYQFVNGRRQLSNYRTAGTNDIGEYRLFGIPPGQYFVTATARQNNVNDALSEDRTGYAPTFFPGTANVGEAQRITLGIGQQLNDINIALSPMKMARISGTAVDSQGRPVQGILMMIRTQGGFTSSLGSQIRPDGTFSIGGVTPGDYALRAMIQATGLGILPEAAQTELTVAGDDINDVRLVGVKPSKVTGRVVSVTPVDFRQLTMLMVAKIQTPFGGGTGRATEDGTFELNAQPGNWQMALVPTGAFASVRIKAVRINGADVTDAGFDVKPNEDLSGVEIELTSQMASVTGVVTDARGNPAKDYTVLIFPRDKERWEATSRYLAVARPDQEGRYKAQFVLPGAYYGIALDYVEQGANTDPEFLDRIKERAVEFSIADTETKPLDLRLTTAP